MELDDAARQENEGRVAEEYLSSLQDLTCNSKPLINVLTILAEENIDYAPVIVNMVQKHIAKVSPEIKLPLLYLIDSIVKNVKNTYIQLFSQCIVNIFCGVFETVNEKVRERMYALRQTWNEIFSPAKLYALDVKVKLIDGNWPITAKPPQPSIHVNPNFLKQNMPVEEILQAKTRELLELKKRKLELELQATMKSLEEQDKKNVKPNESSGTGSAAGSACTAASSSVAPSTNTTTSTTSTLPLLPGQVNHSSSNSSSSNRSQNAYNQNYRHNRGQNFPPTSQPNNQPQSTPSSGNFQMNAPTNNSGIKMKVNPVNPAMISSLRNRDPRLAKHHKNQQQQQHEQQMQQQNNSHSQNHTPFSNSSSSSRADNKMEDKNDIRSFRGSSRSHSDNDRKLSSPSRSSSSRSSGRSSSNKSSSREKDRDNRNKRPDSKSSSSSSDRHRKPGSSSGSGSEKKSSDAIINAGISSFSSSSSKRKSASPNRSPTKHSTSSKDLKKSSKSKTGASTTNSNATTSGTVSVSSRNGTSRNTSRSPSPKSYKDGEKRRKLSGSFGSDHEKEDLPKTASSAALAQDLDKHNLSTESTNATSTTPSSAETIASTQASSALGTAESSAATNEKQLNSVSHLDSKMPTRRVSNQSKDGDDKNKSSTEDDIRKRVTPAVTDDAGDNTEPLAKKSRTSSKIELLFGEEDMDIRADSPIHPLINVDKKAESWDNLKSKSDKPGALKKGNSLDDVRAKLAKAAKYNKFNKQEKSFKSGENSLNSGIDVTISEDSLEANDEKIRTMISQAQEMLETNSIDKEQYKNLLQNVMCINETNKLKEAQRRESLNVQKPATPAISPKSEKNYKERMAAKEAIFRKRIPKIPRKSTDENKAENVSPFNEASSSPSYEDKGDEENTAVNAKPMNKVQRDRRNKSTKWSERFEAPTPSMNLNINPPTNFGPPRPWMNNANNMQNKRGMGPVGNFRPNVPAPVIPPLINPNMMRMTQPHWQMGNNSGFNQNNMGPNNMGPSIMGPNNLGPSNLGPNNMGPNNMGPNNLGPNNMSSNNMGPSNMGPTNMGPTNMNNFIPSMGGPNSGSGPTGPPPNQPPSLLNIPTKMTSGPSLPKPCNSIDNPQAEMVRTITIDGVAKEIRIYDKIAIVFMEIDEPREIGFQNGQRNIYIDNQEPITLRFNDEYRVFAIDGKMHHLRFGFPSRELYIDEHWYEIYFGGSAVSIPLGNRQHIIKAEGPPPQVNIGPLRKDLVVGKINMIVDAYTVVPLFLDARIQKYHLNDKDHTVQFADNLLTILLDGEPYQVEYGGLPKSYNLGGKKYFIRFGALPKGVEPGKVFIRNMLYIKMSPPSGNNPMLDDDVEVIPPSLSNAGFESDNLSSANRKDGLLPGMDALADANKQNKPLMQNFSNPPPAIEQPSVSSATTPASQQNPPANSGPAGTVDTTATNATTATAPALPALNNLNIDELFQKLVSSGILNTALPVAPVVANFNSTTAAGPPGSATPIEKIIEPLETKLEANTNSNSSSVPPVIKASDSPQKVVEPIQPIDLTKPESIKTRQAAIIATLYSGMQCSSCGVRFPPEQTMKYSQHLDWHFRQNRRERDSARKAHFRKWYYDLSDWVQYEEVEDLDDREKNFFETQQCDMDTMDENSNQRSMGSPIPTCPAGPDDVDRHCDMCQEKFEQFYNEDLEEWHLKSAIRVENNIYHPLCYEDYKASLNPKKEEVQEDVKEKHDSLITDDDNAVDIIIKSETGKENEEKDDVKASVTINDDDEDDDDVIVLPNEEPSVTEIVDDDEDEEYVPANVTREEMGPIPEDENTKDNETENQNPNANVNENDANNDAMEDDVQIQEPHIPFTDLDTYVEKELPTLDENSQLSFLNVKIKEEPKDDDEYEDDGFEDVGTVLIDPAEEISLQSSEGSQSQVFPSCSADGLLEKHTGEESQHGGENASNANKDEKLEGVSQEEGLLGSAPTASSGTSEQAGTDGSSANAENSSTTTTTSMVNTISSIITESTPNLDMNLSMDGDFETSFNEHNLSAAGPAPAIPIASLVNKIKININKNNSSSSASASTSSSSTTSTSSSISTISSLPSSSNSISTIASNNHHSNMHINTNTNINTNNNHVNNFNSNPMPTSNIPIIANTISTITTNSMGISSTPSIALPISSASISSYTNNSGIITNSNINSNSNSTSNSNSNMNSTSINNTNSNYNSNSSQNSRSEYSTIPVLCSGGSNLNRYPTQAQLPLLPNMQMMMPMTNPMMMPSRSNANTIMSSNNNLNHLNSTNSSGPNGMNNISAISVIGSSYGMSSSNLSNPNPLARMQPNLTISTPMTTSNRKVPTPPAPIQVVAQSLPVSNSTSSSATTSATISASNPAPAPAPIPYEDTITYEVKPALKEANLKKMKKLEKGIETSGLCSIM